MPFEGWPGEALIIKIWDTLFDRGVAGLLRPRQILREEAARAEARRHEMLVIEQTRKEIQGVRNGTMAYEGGELVAISLPSEVPQIESATRADDPQQETHPIDSEYIADLSRREVALQQMERTANLHQIALYAEEEAEGTPNEAVSDEPINPDWFTRWRECAQQVSVEELQRLWARVLKGELKQPGSCSLHTMDVLRRMSMPDAELISLAARYRIARYIVKTSIKLLEDAGLRLDEILKLEALGIMQGIESVGTLQSEWGSDITDSFRSLLPCNNRALLVTHDDPNKKLELPSYGITQVGLEIMMLGSFDADDLYLKQIGSHLKEQGFVVHIGDWQRVDDEHGRLLNQEPI